MPTAMVGGSFDPIHLGHLHLVHTVATSTPYRRFVFVPVARNNFKQDARMADENHRLNMLRLCFNHYRILYPEDPPLTFIIERCELDRGGVSYTYDTVRYLDGSYAIEGKLAVVMGDDLLRDLKKWHEYEKLRDLVTFVVIRRENSPIDFADPKASLVYLQNPMVDDSSTLIRQTCQQLGNCDPLPLSVKSLMCPEVADYVEKHRLYRS